MDEVNLVVLTAGRCVDACCLLFDMLTRTFSWLLRFLSGVAAFLHDFLSGSTLVEYGNFALFPFLSATEAVSSATCGALQTVDGWLQSLGGVFETFKMVGHLLCHMAWRVKDVLQRGFVSGSCILRQTCEGLCIALSLVLYVVNTAINILLIGMQNCLSAAAGVWDTVAAPLHKALELAVTLLTFLYSCLLGTSVLLWTPCQLLLDFLAGLGQLLFCAFTVDVRVLLATAGVVSLALLLLNTRLPDIAVRLSLRVVSALLRARGTQATPEGVDQELQTQEVSSHAAALTSETEQQSANETTRRSDEPVSSGRTEASQTDRELLSLLKEQEERKKCVICQDLSKTVLLLPCRHLCLCRPCADILSRHRHIQQRCCPLCRQHITQTMDVFL